MTEHYDAHDTRAPASARPICSVACRPSLPRRSKRRPMRSACKASIQGASRAARPWRGCRILRKAELPGLQKASPPFGGFVSAPLSTFGRLFTSPGPIFEPEGRGDDPWGAARALHAMGFRPGDVVLNTFGYHLTPGGFIMDSGARALGCVVIPPAPATPSSSSK
jgi:phenylacetate-CoA ligase